MKRSIIPALCAALILIGALPLSPAAQSAAEAFTVFSDEDGTALAQGAERELSFSCPADGRYHVQIDYRTVAGRTVTPQLGITVDGGAQQILDAPRLWSFARTDGRFPKDEAGNELMPAAIEIEERQTLRLLLSDDDGETKNGLPFSAGEHRLTLCAVREELTLYAVRLVPHRDLPSYAAYRAASGDAPSAGAFSHTYEAELFDRRSHPEIALSFDRSSAAVTPNDPAAVCYNIVGGTGWASPGQWLSWSVEVPQDGYYALDFVYRQNTVQGQSSGRSVLIDGVCPFAEAQTLAFPFSYGFSTVTLTADGSEAPVYLTAGRHELTLLTVTPENAQTIRALSAQLQTLNSLYAKIVRITGEAPDSYRDYGLKTGIAGLTDTLTDSADALDALAQRLIGAHEQTSSAASQLDQLTELLRTFAARPRKIPQRLGDLRSQLNTLSALISSLDTQPLELDSLTVRAADTPRPARRVSAGETFAFRLRSFLSSFFTDYQAASGTGEPLDVWVTANALGTFGFATGREQAQIVLQLARSGFAAETGIGVQISLMDASVLLQALVSGKGPDAALFVPELTLSNLYFRNALEDLGTLPDFARIGARFLPSALTALSYGGRTYALPEVQIFDMMFCRTDVLAEYGLQPPETWDDFYAVLNKLQKNGMQAGIGESQKTYETFLFQNGGELYRPDLSGTGLTDDAAVRAFTQWTDLYGELGVPVSFDALNRFRSGQVPVAIASAAFYNSLTVGAPEIGGLWTMSPVPGTRRADGTVDHTESCSVSGAVVPAAGRRTADARRFVEWWTRDGVQSAFAAECEVRFGLSARYFPANVQAMDGMSWSAAELAVLGAQRSVVRGVQQSPAAYFLSRNLSNAFRRVVYQAELPRDVIFRYARETDDELARKREKLRLTPQQGE